MTVTTTYQFRNLTERSLNYSIVDLTSTHPNEFGPGLGGFDGVVLSETSNSTYYRVEGNWGDSLGFFSPQTGTDPNSATRSQAGSIIVAQTSGGLGVG